MNDTKTRKHPDEDSLERFLLNMSSEEELETLEPHILACGDCIELLETLENEITATRMALKQLPATEQILKSSKEYSRRRRSWLAFRRGSFAAGGALAAGAVILFSFHEMSTLPLIAAPKRQSCPRGEGFEYI